MNDIVKAAYVRYGDNGVVYRVEFAFNPTANTSYPWKVVITDRTEDAASAEMHFYQEQNALYRFRRSVERDLGRNE